MEPPRRCDPVVAAALARFDRARVPAGDDPLLPMRALLAALGDPHLASPPCLHIAGTNGKGSVAALARAVAEAAGLSVHVFTSPHLVRPNERIRLRGALIGDEALVAALDEVSATGQAPTYFEAFAAAAFLEFSRIEADIAIIETGAGGSYDATNVLPSPQVSVITSIGRDHEAMFGVSDELAIARVKAGIMRNGRPVVIARQSDPVRDVLLDCADQIGADPCVCDTHWRCSSGDDGFVFSTSRFRLGPMPLALAGRFQADNAGAALVALSQMQAVDRDAIRAAACHGMANVAWPGRLQRLRPGPLTEAAERPIFVDGAHNVSGARVLADEIIRRGKRSAMVMAVGIAKPAAAMIGELSASVSGAVFCSLPDPAQEAAPQGISPEELARIAVAHGVCCRVTADLPEAVAAAAELGEDIYICGSLYLVGEALRLNHEIPN